MSINKIIIVRELLNYYSNNFSSDDFANDLTKEHRPDNVIETYTKEIYAEIEDFYPGPSDLMSMYWWHKGRTSTKKIPESQKEISEGQKSM